ncbi:hypothetical protein A9Q99_14145 [Gammaproteobacteria bacterium 45_16_T64]|nr:hypothetical protein A9Q99_14145 [Gammaproteobacteria bacterium 45_16_T64]
MVASLWASSLHAVAEPSIRWLVWDFKPDFIEEGPYKHQGYGDKLLAYLKTSLPQYKHTQLYVNGKRWAVEALRSQTCTPLLWLGFLPKNIVYSKAYGVTAPYVLVAHGKKSDLIGKPGDLVSLEHILQKRSLTLGVLPVYFDATKTNTRYPVLHSYIAPYIGTKKVMEFGGGTNQLNLKLLDADRVDYVIENPLTAPTQAKLNNTHNPYINYRLTEHRVHKKIAIACNNDEFGRHVIDQINPLITDEFIKMFLINMEEWNGQDANFRKTVMDYFIYGVDTGEIVN